MVASASDLAAGIAPGSLEYGDRAPLEAGLASGGTSTAPPGPASGVAPPVDSVGDPLAALANGDINPGGDGGPLTSGLSVGPGPGPLGSDQVDPRRERLIQVMENAQSPILRAAARNALRSLSTGGV